MPEARRVPAALSATMLRRNRSCVTSASAPTQPAQARPSAGRSVKPDPGPSRTTARGRGASSPVAAAPLQRGAAAQDRPRGAPKRHSKEEVTDVAISLGDAANVSDTGGSGGGTESASSGGAGVGDGLGRSTSAEAEAGAVEDSRVARRCGVGEGDEERSDVPEASDMEYESSSQGSDGCDADAMEDLGAMR